MSFDPPERPRDPRIAAVADGLAAQFGDRAVAVAERQRMLAEGEVAATWEAIAADLRGRV